MSSPRTQTLAPTGWPEPRARNTCPPLACSRLVPSLLTLTTSAMLFGGSPMMPWRRLNGLVVVVMTSLHHYSLSYARSTQSAHRNAQAHAAPCLAITAHLHQIARRY